MDEQEMAKEWTIRRIMSGPPTHFSIQSKDNAGAYYVRFNKVATELTRVEYKYIEIPEALTDSATSIPMIPVEHRDCLALAAAHYLLLDKNDSRSEKFMQLTQQKLKAMQKAEEKQKTQTSKLRGKLMPRRDIWQRSKRYVVQETS
jgi:CRISPR/Cas system-associated endonuclease/helicase Cas3